MPERAPALGSHETAVITNRLGRTWLLALYSSLRTTQFHEAENDIFNDPIRNLCEAGDGILGTDGRIEFRIIEDQFFLNGVWIKPGITEKDTLFAFADFLAERKIGGFTVRAAVDDGMWRVFLRIYQTANIDNPNFTDDFNRELAKNNIEAVEVHGPFVLKEMDEKDLPFPRPAYDAVKTYTRCLLVVREFSLAARGEEQVSALRKAQRIVCDLVNILEKSPRLFLALSLLKNVDTYFFHHGVNVCILALALARSIGFDRRGFADLGMAALLHDVGRLSMPQDMLNKPGELTSEEWALMRRHPIDSARSFLLLGYMNESVAERTLVAYQHHWAARLPTSYPIPRRQMEPTLFASIVAVCVAYDALTTDKAYGKGFAPYEAVRILAAEAERGRYRKDLVRALCSLLGPLPLGNWASLETGQSGLVAAGGSHSPAPPYPLIFVPTADRTGSWIDISLTHVTLKRKPRVSAGTTDAATYRRAVAAMFASSKGFLFG